MSLADEGILACIGNTPLIPLKRLHPAMPLRVYGKLEQFNPGGSVKDRPAYTMIKGGIEMGCIRPDSVVIESSSGNMAIGLAQVCLFFGLRLICVVDPKTTRQNLEILRAYGAEIEMVHQPHPVTGEFLTARLERVHMLMSTIDGAFWPDQYSNILNAKAHHRTMQEIVDRLRGSIDYLFCPTSTCGTIRGCAEYAREHGLRLCIVGVDAIGSVIFGGERSRRLLPGLGASVRPRLFERGVADKSVLVSDLDCIVGCRKLLKKEAILAGGSSGAVVSAFERLAGTLPRDSTCVLVFPDRGERYTETIYSDRWVREHFGEVTALSDRGQENQQWGTAASH